MARVKKPTQKKKATVIKEPDWKKLRKVTDEQERIDIWRQIDTFVHYEVTDKEYLHSTKKWVRDHTDLGVYDTLIRVPDTHITIIAKHGWKAYTLGWMPEKIAKGFNKHVLGLCERVEELRERMDYAPPVSKHVANIDDEESDFHINKVKAAIAHWQQYMKSLDKEKQVSQYNTAKTYVSNMQTFLRTGEWLDSHCGLNREKKVIHVCLAPAFDKNGLQKRTKGVYYPDLDMIWGEEDGN